MPLLRRHLTPLLAQLLTPFRRHLAESIEGFAHFVLPFGRQRLELLPALTQQLPLLRRHGAPLTESLLGAGALLRRHGYPALAALRERLLPLRRQAVPLALIALQHLLLLRRERLPSLGAGGRRSGRPVPWRPRVGAGAGVCAKLVAALNARLAQRAKYLIISSHPAAALREEDHSLAAAPSSKTPTKQHRPHRPNPKTRGNSHRASPAVWPMTPAVAGAAAAAPAPAPLQRPAAVQRLPSRTAHRAAASSLRSPRKSTYAAGPEFAALSAKS